MSNKLFVDNDEDEDEVLIDASVDEQRDEIQEDKNINTDHNGGDIGLKHASELVVDINEHDDDDPIVTEIPIVIKQKPSNQELYLFQYPSRPNTRPFQDQSKIVSSRYKPKSKLIQVDTPIDTTKFYDANKSDQWGGYKNQSLQGVLIDMKGYYTGSIIKGELILNPLDSIVQLRPSLQHIDKEAAEKKELLKLENNQTNQNGYNSYNSGVQVVQMTVKNSSDATPRLNGALLARKKVDEEEFSKINWNDLKDESTNVKRKELVNVENVLLRKKLTSTVDKNEYMDLLVQETI